MEEQKVLKKEEREHVSDSSFWMYCTRITSVESNQETTPQATPQANVNILTQPTGPKN